MANRSALSSFLNTPSPRLWPILEMRLCPLLGSSCCEKYHTNSPSELLSCRWAMCSGDHKQARRSSNFVRSRGAMATRQGRHGVIAFGQSAAFRRRRPVPRPLAPRHLLQLRQGFLRRLLCPLWEQYSCPQWPAHRRGGPSSVVPSWQSPVASLARQALHPPASPVLSLPASWTSSGLRPAPSSRQRPSLSSPAPECS